MARAGWLLWGLVGVAFLLSVAQLQRLEAGGPPHERLVLEGGIPATLYHPGPGRPFQAAPPPERAARPPVIVLAHGFAGNRAMPSSLARRLAAAGYAVLVPDLQGHGENRNPFTREAGRPDSLFPDLAAAVDFARGSPLVDGGRIAVAGHSMGAAAALDYATRDSGLDAAILISGGVHLHGPYPPPNAFFVYAEGDPARTRTGSQALAAWLAGVPEPRDGARYGDFALGTAVGFVEVPGENHLTVLWSERTAAEIVRWLDATFGIERAREPDLGDPRLATAGLAALLLLPLLFGLGFVTARLTPAHEGLPAGGELVFLGALGLTLAALAPLVALAPPAGFLGLAVGDVVVSQLSLAGVVLLVVATLRGRRPSSLWGPSVGRSLAAAGAAFAGAFAALAPLGVVVCGLVPTPERLLAAAGATLLLLPFFLAFEHGLRRGGNGRAALFGAAGRVLLLLVTLGATLAGALPRVVLLMLPSLALLQVLFELVAFGIHARSRNALVIALLESAWLAWILAVSMPMRV
jgi:dienelactone hydrolase